MKRYLPHAVVATALVLGLPAALAWLLTPAGSLAWAIAAVPLAMALSVAVAAAGSSMWARRPASRDLVFADLMLWGWIRRLRAERRLAEARNVLGTTGERTDGLAPGERVRALSRLSALLEARDAYTHRHSRRVTRHAERIARAMRLAAGEVAKIRTAAALHDLGKIHTPREILNKSGRLTDDEFAVMRRHPVDGADMLAGIEDPEITAMVRHHHERLDGGGYPDGLAGDAIPLGARIIAVADTFDAMTSSRSYRGPCTHKWALEVLAKEAGTQLDPDAVRAFLDYYSARRSIAWSALVTTVPQRLLGVLGTSSQGLAAGAVSQLLPALGAATVLATSAGGASDAARPPTVTAERPVPARSTHAAHPKPAAGPAERRARRRQGAATPAKTRGSGRRADAPRAAPPARGEHAKPEHSSGSDASPPGDGARRAEQPPVKAPTPTPAPTPEVELPAVEVPSIKVPDVEVIPGVELPAVETPPVKLPEVELPPVALPDVKLP